MEINAWILSYGMLLLDEGFKFQNLTLASSTALKVMPRMLIHLSIFYWLQNSIPNSMWSCSYRLQGWSSLDEVYAEFPLLPLSNSQASFDGGGVGGIDHMSETKNNCTINTKLTPFEISSSVQTNKSGSTTCCQQHPTSLFPYSNSQFGRWYDCYMKNSIICHSISADITKYNATQLRRDSLANQNLHQALQDADTKPTPKNNLYTTQKRVNMYEYDNTATDNAHQLQTKQQPTHG